MNRPYTVICAPAGSGLGKALTKIVEAKPNITIVSVDDELCSLADTQEALARTGHKPSNSSGGRKIDIRHVTWNLSRVVVQRLWAQALRVSLERLSKAPQNHHLAIACHLVYYGGNRNEFYCPVEAALLRAQVKNNSFEPSHVLVLIDDVYDTYIRLSQPGGLFDPVRGMGELATRVKEQEGIDLSTDTLSPDDKALLFLEWKLSVMTQLLSWRHNEMIMADNLGIQLGRPHFLVWGVKQLTQVVMEWLTSDHPTSVYLSHPITRPRRMQKDHPERKWPDMVGEFNEIQAELSRSELTCVMPTAIDEYRLHHERAANTLSRRDPILGPRWPLPDEEHGTEKVLYTFPTTIPDKDHTNILAPVVWDVDRRLGTILNSDSPSLRKMMDVLLRGFEKQVELQVSSRDHLFVARTQHILIYRPHMSSDEPPSLSSGVESEIRHWRILARGDDQRRAAFIHLREDVEGVIEYFNGNPFRGVNSDAPDATTRRANRNRAMHYKVLHQVTARWSLEDAYADALINQIRNGHSYFLEHGPFHALEVAEELPTIERMAREEWLWDELTGGGITIGIGGVPQEQVGLWVVDSIDELKQNYTAIAEFLKTGSKVRDNWREKVEDLIENME